MKKGQWSEKKDVRLGNICLAFDGKMPMTRLLTPADYSGYSIGCLSKAKPKAIFDFLWSDSDDFWNPFLNVQVVLDGNLHFGGRFLDDHPKFVVFLFFRGPSV